MFEPQSSPRVFAVPLGTDFPKTLVSGLLARSAGQPPEALARVQLIVNTRRMARRIKTLFGAGPALLLPKIELVTSLSAEDIRLDLPAPVPPLRRRLELTQLVSRLLDAQPDLAARASLYDLADSLARLMDEMHGEGVSPEAIETLNIEDQSGHWARIKAFLGIVRHYFEDAHDAPDVETLQRRVIECLMARWEIDPPQHPVIVAGSTGSRGATQLLMQAVAKLPQGAVVLPGFDMDMPLDVWGMLESPLLSEDHPQYRFADFLRNLDVSPDTLPLWAEDRPANLARNKLVSLALRPAPVTDQWLRDGPDLTDLDFATRDVTLLEAPSTRIEALCIAMRLREAAETGQSAALITPDRTLARQVTAALNRWDIIPDDSAGIPLHLSPPGRFMRHVGELYHQPLSAASLLTLLKHPLTHSGAARGPHVRLTHELELYLRREGVPYPNATHLQTWAAQVKDEMVQRWVEWVIASMTGCTIDRPLQLEELIDKHTARAETIARGSQATDGSGGLWDMEAGRELRKTVSNLAENASYGGSFSAVDYSNLFHAILTGKQVRKGETSEVHPRILIWGTLEARVQGADLLILAGLNEGGWPAAPPPDPWLNRELRAQAKLLLPERRIGLSAHDFQQAVLAPQVWLTRSVRSDDAQTVPSRWLNRLQNLLSGLPNGGQDALKAMKRRGRVWLKKAELLETPQHTPRAIRPSPRPPADVRPRQLSVTEIQRLIRDPYAIYAKHILRLRPLDPLMQLPDALLRGTAVHKVLESFITATKDDSTKVSVDRFLKEIEMVLTQEVPWAEARSLWKAKLARVADSFVTNERDRRLVAQPRALEVKGEARIKALDFTLTTKADRIDIAPSGAFHIYDYKTGAPPTSNQQKHFDKQLLLEVAIAEREGFEGLPPSTVEEAVYISFGSEGKQASAPIEDETPVKVWAELETLIGSYLDASLGFTARRAMKRVIYESDYDQLARFGEWDISDDPEPEDLK